MRNGRIILMLVCVLLLSACHTAKFVPEGKHLLYKTRVVVDDTHEIQPSDLKGYLKQTHNTEILGFWKLQLDIYNTASTDTTKKINRWWSRVAKKMGEAPEVYDPVLTEASRQELKKAMQSKGYFLCEVDTNIEYLAKQKVMVTYRVQAGEPYRIRRHSYDLSGSEDLRTIAEDERRTLIRDGDCFDATVLDNERSRIAGRMRRMGYYHLNKDVLRYTADSTAGGKQVDVEMRMAKSINELSEKDRKRLFTQYTIRRVCFHTDYDPAYVPDSTLLHREEDAGYEYTWVGQQLMRPSALRHNCRIRPGELYNERRVEQTYEMLNQLGIVRYVEITFDEVSSDSLDCHVVMSRGKLNAISTEVEGTYSNGDWGVAAGVGYINRNLFKGAEELQLGVNGSYEWRANGGRAIEAKANASLAFSNHLKVSAGYHYQTRPDEFTRTIANASLGYRLPQLTQGWTHTFNFVDLSYVYLPWVSEEFRNRFITNQNPLKYSYENHFIEAINYSCRYSGYSRLRPTRSYITFYGFAETAGNVFYGASKLFVKQPEDGIYKIGNVAFSQYVKLDANWTYNQIITDKHRLVYHAAAGVAVPYGNSLSIPYEKRYFAGGSNHVRGWIARTLGPGAYRGDGTRIDYDNQAGDIHLDLSVEYRWRVWNFIELALFTDAGNIWTIREYDSQPYGAFKWNEFYRQIAWSYGGGVRLDLKFLIFRVDFGVKLYDPSRIYYDQKQWRTASNRLNWSDDVAVHFAIGYPF
ncbi:MAG: BamA/TamA family outer membrane protein [Paludibacteraceae bacterium]|nr:BamA/TamA family outer membrane protein [Paludibacteraceae bacterium]